MFHYLDNAATTPVRPEAAQAALEAMTGQPLLPVRPGEAGGGADEELARRSGRGSGL